MYKPIYLSVNDYDKLQQPLTFQPAYNIHLDRINCWDDTKTLSETISPPPPSIKIHWSAELLTPQTTRTIVEIENEDALDAGLRLQNQGYGKVLVLNLADDRRAGGCIDSGSGAQEESLFRRTNYHKTLTQDLYPIVADEAVYSPRVTVMKSSEKDGWKRLEQYRLVDFVACPGLRYPALFRDAAGESRIKPPADQVLKRKIETILQLACREKYDAVVLGAMGCGVWQTPSKHAAEIFRQVIEEKQGYVPQITFAIMHKKADGEYSGEEVTCDVFRQVFEMPVLLGSRLFI